MSIRYERIVFEREADATGEFAEDKILVRNNKGEAYEIEVEDDKEEKESE